LAWWGWWLGVARGRRSHCRSRILGAVVVWRRIPLLSIPLLLRSVLCSTSCGRPAGSVGLYPAVAISAPAAELLVLLPRPTGLLSLRPTVLARVDDSRSAAALARPVAVRNAEARQFPLVSRPLIGGFSFRLGHHCGDLEGSGARGRRSVFATSICVNPAASRASRNRVRNSRYAADRLVMRRTLFYSWCICQNGIYSFPRKKGHPTARPAQIPVRPSRPSRRPCTPLGGTTAVPGPDPSRRRPKAVAEADGVFTTGHQKNQTVSLGTPDWPRPLASHDVPQHRQLTRRK